MHLNIVSRRIWLAGGLALAFGTGCGTSEPVTLPATVTALGREFRQAGTPGATLELQADWRNMAVRRGATAAYGEGNSAVSVEVWEFKTPANAFEAIQRWRAQPGMTAFQREGAVVVCAAPGLGQDDLLQFAKRLQESMGAAK